MTFHFDNSWRRDLPGTYLDIAPDIPPAPRLLALNRPLAEALGLDVAALEANGAEWFSGACLPPGAEPLALAYSGHQFGGFSPLLGDGRAHLLGEFLTPRGQRFDLQLKGSGRTPFSRGGDGKAVLGPMLREFLISEAMAALGVPTTRSLAVVTTGEEVIRDGRRRKGAVLARVAASHVRVGSFQFLAARGEGEKLRALADYTIARHFPELEPGDYIGFLDQVIARQAALVARWMGLGFIHGVMNTDNMAISGETIDYGPCAFMERFAPGTVFSSIDHQGRYAWANQPLIMGWNIARLAECLLPLLDADETRAIDLANERLGRIGADYRREWLAVMREKLGLAGDAAEDGALIDDLLAAVAGVDWTGFFHHLAGAAGGEESRLLPLFSDATLLSAWLPRWRSRLDSGSVARMQAVNPAVIPRNLAVEAALAAAEAGDMAPFEALLAAIRQPFLPDEAYMQPAPVGSPAHVTYCGT